MFYRKYRPQKFSEVSQPNEVAEALMTQLKNKKPAQAYLFAGSRGTGKTTIARILAKALNCKNIDKTGDPCGTCESCEAIANGSYIDLIEIDAASNRGIDDIRDLKDKIKLAPAAGKQKVYIIDEVHMLTNEAFNALLKTLEEPPKHATFILCTTEFHKIPDTIKSRCQVFKFKRATIVQLVERFEKICEAEGVKLTKENLKKIAVAANGGFRDADTLLQQVIEGNFNVESFLGADSSRTFISFVDSIIRNDPSAAILQINAAYEQGSDLYVWTTDLLKYFRDLLFISTGISEGITDVTEEALVLMQEQASYINLTNLTRMMSLFVAANNTVRSTVIPQLPIEVAIIEACSLFDDGPSKPTPKIPPAQPTATKKSTEELPKKEEEVVVTATELKITLEEVTTNWQSILKEVSAQNNSVHAIVKSSKPAKIESGLLILEVIYSFHKERLENPKNRKIIEDAFKQVFGCDLGFKCIMSSEKPPVKKDLNETGILTDYNVSALNDKSLEGSLLTVFDGGLPLSSSSK